MAVTITAAQATVMVKALVDAEHYRRDSAPALCVRCAESPDGICPDHDADLWQADVYRDLATRLSHAATKRPAGVREHPGRPRNHSRHHERGAFK